LDPGTSVKDGVGAIHNLSITPSPARATDSAIVTFKTEGGGCVALFVFQGPGIEQTVTVNP